MEEKYEAMEKKLLVMEEEALSSKYITVAANCGLDVVRARVNFQFFSAEIPDIEKTIVEYDGPSNDKQLVTYFYGAIAIVLWKYADQNKVFTNTELRDDLDDWKIVVYAMTAGQQIPKISGMLKEMPISGKIKVTVPGKPTLVFDREKIRIRVEHLEHLYSKELIREYDDISSANK